LRNHFSLKQALSDISALSALPPKADIAQRGGNAQADLAAQLKLRGIAAL
jgi:hypothetical protein